MISLHKLFENILTDNDNIIVDENKFKNNKVIFITGISGSGKTTISKNLCERYNLKYIELDMIKLQISKDKSKDDIFYYKEMAKLIIKHVNNGNVLIEGVQLGYAHSFIPEIINSIFKENAFIFLGTSFLKSGIRGSIRNRKEKQTIINMLGQFTYQNYDIKNKIVELKKWRLSIPHTIVNKFSGKL